MAISSVMNRERRVLCRLGYNINALNYLVVVMVGDDQRRYQLYAGRWTADSQQDTCSQTSTGSA